MEIRKINQNRPRIALLIARWTKILGGRQVLVLKLAEFLSANGYDVDIITSGNAPKNNVNIKYIKFPRFLYTICASIYLAFKGKKYQALHAHSRMANLATKIGSFFSNSPSVMTVHSTHLFENSFSFKKYLDKFIYLFINYDQVTSATNNFLKIKNTSALHIPHGIDLEVFDATESQKDPQTFNVLFVGDLSTSKGVDVLLKAIKKLVESENFLQSHKEFFCNIVGDGKERKKLAKWAIKNGINKWIKFNGYKTGESLIALYKKSNLFVLPSRLEGMPLTLLEACASRLPILATNTGDNAEFVIENSNGHLVPTNNVDELAYYLEYFALNPALEKMGELSYELVKEHYNWSIILEKYLRIYEQVYIKKKVKKNEFSLLDIPKIYLQKNYFKNAKVPKDTLKFCLSLDVEQMNASEELPHEAQHIGAFLERFSDFTNSLELPSTLFVQNDLLAPFSAELKAMEDGGHEIGLKINANQWSSVPLQKKTLRFLRDTLESNGFEHSNFIKFADGIDDTENLLAEYNFEKITISSDPLLHVKWRFFMPKISIVKMNLFNFLTLNEEDLLSAINRIKIVAKKQKKDTVLIFESKSWEFQSKEGFDFPSGQNFTDLAKRLAFLREKMDVKFISLQELN